MSVQVRAAGDIPSTDHDVPVDLIVTPTRIIETGARRTAGRGRLHWDELTEEKVAAIPLLRRLAPQ